MYKQLKDYTLGDLKTVCENNNRDCSKCMFRSIRCWMTYPAYYELSEKIIFSSEEARTAEELVRCFGKGARIKKANSEDEIQLYNLASSVKLNGSAFPSLAMMDHYDIGLKDIVDKGAVEID